MMWHDVLCHLDALMHFISVLGEQFADLLNVDPLDSQDYRGFKIASDIYHFLEHGTALPLRLRNPALANLFGSP